MRSRSTQIGVAVVGLGVGEQHARAYLATGRCQVRWLYDLDATKAALVAATLGAGAPAESFEQIVQDPQIDIISIASYDDAHFAQVVAALEAGKHVFVEKPLCHTMSDLWTIKNVWRQHRGRLKLSSNLVLRAAPAYEWLKQKISTGDFGDLYAFDGDYLYGRLEKITEGWRAQVRDYSVMHGGGVHLIDLFLWLAGERPTSVHAAGNRISTAHTAFRYPDYVAATLRCPSGLVGRITANFGCVHRHQHVLRVFGTKATFVSDDSGPRVHLTRDPGVGAGFLTLPPLPMTKGVLIAPFVAAVLTDEDLDAHTQTMFDVLSVCAACDEALHSHSEVEVCYV